MLERSLTGLEQKRCETCARQDASSFVCPYRCEWSISSYPDWLPKGENEEENRRIVRIATKRYVMSEVVYLEKVGIR